MGYLSSGAAGNLLNNITRPDPLKGLLPNVAKQKKHQEQRAQIAQATAVANAAAKAQQLDLVSQAQAVAEQQTNLALRQAAEDKAAEMQSKPMDTVDVSIGEQSTSSPTATRAARRKQFFNTGGYTPGVTI